MATCTNCQQQWTWKDIWKVSLRLDTRLPCPYCGEIQFISKKSRKQSLYFNLMIPIPFLLLLFNASWIIILLVWIAMVLIFIITYPYIVQLSDTEEDHFTESLKKNSNH